MGEKTIMGDFARKVMHCTKCAISSNQAPLLDTTSEPVKVFWVGLSAVRVEDVAVARPLSEDTRSGKLVKEIESRCPKVSFHHTNLVKCLPELNGKIRYPRGVEMKSCYPYLEKEIRSFSPEVVLLLGKQVISHVLKQFETRLMKLDDNYNYAVFKINGIKYVPIHHPSYILIYKRKSIESYINRVCRIITGDSGDPQNTKEATQSPGE